MDDIKPSHPFAEIFPLRIDGKEFEDLVDDIRRNGCFEAIIIYHDQILDGRRRERACKLAGKIPKYISVTDRWNDEKSLEYVMAKNLNRRHLSENERVLAAARYANARRGGNAGQNATQETDTPVVTTSQAAEQFNVGKRTLERARRIVTQGTEALQKAVAEGEMTVAVASEVAAEPKEEQEKVVEDVKSGKPVSINHRRSKQGKAIFDDKIIEKLIGKLAKAFDDRCQLRGEGRVKATECLDALDAVANAWRQWQASEERPK